MIIRDATRSDIPAIVSLLADDQFGERREAPADPLPDDYWSAFDAIDKQAGNHLILAEDAGEIVGTLQLTFLPHLTFRGGWRAQIEAVRVAAGRRHQGLGRELLQWAITEAEKHNCHLVQLTTNKHRDKAQRFYESLGFDATHEGMKLYLSGSVIG